MSGTVYPVSLIYTDADFRAQFPYFSDVNCYPTATLQMWFGLAGDYISNQNYGIMRDGQRQYALYLMTAHLQFISDGINSPDNADGSASGIVTQARVDKTQVTIQAPPGKTAFAYWLNQSPYGQQLLALLSMLAVGGFYGGGRPELAAFRRVGGFFGR